MRKVTDAAISGTPSTYVGAKGVITIDENNVIVSVHNGVTKGGVQLNTGATVKSVAVVGGTTGLFTRGGPIVVAGTITLDGVLSVTNGGTGSTNSSDALKAIAPLQAGQAGRYLSTDGTTISWQPIPQPSIRPNYAKVKATTNQTIFSLTIPVTASSDGKANQMVYVNGVLQVEGFSYDISGSKQITFAAGLGLNDDVIVYSFL